MQRDLYDSLVLGSGETQGVKLSLEYFLTRVAASGGLGVGISMRPDEGESVYHERNGITESEEEAIALLGLLKRNSVTPTTLDNVVDDYIRRINY